MRKILKLFDIKIYFLFLTFLTYSPKLPQKAISQIIFSDQRLRLDFFEKTSTTAIKTIAIKAEKTKENPKKTKVFESAVFAL